MPLADATTPINFPETSAGCLKEMLDPCSLRGTQRYAFHLRAHIWPGIGFTGDRIQALADSLLIDYGLNQNVPICVLPNYRTVQGTAGKILQKPYNSQLRKKTFKFLLCQEGKACMS
jgi:hypothetical protein